MEDFTLFVKQCYLIVWGAEIKTLWRKIPLVDPILP